MKKRILFFCNPFISTLLLSTFAAVLIFHSKVALVKVGIDLNNVETALPWEDINLTRGIKFPSFLNGDLIEQLLQGLLKTALSTLILVLVWSLTHRIFSFIQRRAEPLYAKYVKTIRLGSKDLIDAEQITSFLRRMIRWSSFLALAGVFLLYINVVLSFFPQTQSISSQVSQSIFTSISQIAQGFIGYIPKLIFLIILSLLTYYFLKLIRFVFEEIEKEDISVPGFEAEWATSTARIAQIVALALFLVIAFPYFPGAGSDAFKGISLFLGILLSLGSSTAIANMISGILLTYTRAFRIGDDVEIDGVCGKIIEKGLLTTRLLNYSNQYVSIPNSKVLGSNVVNFRATPNPKGEQHPPPVVSVEVEIPYNNYWQDVYKIMLEAGQETDNVLKEPEPKVFHTNLNNIHAVYTLKVSTNKPTLRLSSELRRRIQEKLHTAGIEMVTTQYVAYRNGEQPAILKNTQQQEELLRGNIKTNGSDHEDRS